MLVVEVITPGGHWSSYPPHKHDRDALPDESYLEETYYHRLKPAQGFAFQRVYTEDGAVDETLTVKDGDVVLVPRGYHPVAAPHGYDLYYLNVMAGPNRIWRFHNDPAHEWLMAQGSLPDAEVDKRGEPARLSLHEGQMMTAKGGEASMSRRFIASRPEMAKRSALTADAVRRLIELRE